MYGISLLFMGMGILWAVELFLSWAVRPKHPPEICICVLLQPGENEPEQVVRWLESRGFSRTKAKEHVFLLDCGLSGEERILYRAFGQVCGFSFLPQEETQETVEKI